MGKYIVNKYMYSLIIHSRSNTFFEKVTYIHISYINSRDNLTHACLLKILKLLILIYIIKEKTY